MREHRAGIIEGAGSYENLRLCRRTRTRKIPVTVPDVHALPNSSSAQWNWKRPKDPARPHLQDADHEIVFPKSFRRFSSPPRRSLRLHHGLPIPCRRISLLGRLVRRALAQLLIRGSLLAGRAPVVCERNRRKNHRHPSLSQEDGAVLPAYKFSRYSRSRHIQQPEPDRDPQRHG